MAAYAVDEDIQLIFYLVDEAGVANGLYFLLDQGAVDDDGQAGVMKLADGAAAGDAIVGIGDGGIGHGVDEPVAHGVDAVGSKVFGVLATIVLGAVYRPGGGGDG